MSSALVTGGGGFIGSHLVDRLLETGSEITVLDDFTTGREENLAHLASQPRVRVVKGSVVDAALVEELARGQAVIYHLAAVVGVRHILNDPLRSMVTSVLGTENVLSAALRHGSRVLFASTSEVYGRGVRLPFNEMDDRVLGPTWVHRWSYATAKALDEHLCFAYADRGLEVSVVRYFNSYGPRISADGYGSVIARFAAQALAGEPLTVHGDGQQTRCFTYVSDTVEGTVLAATRPEARGLVINIGSTEEISVRELAERVRVGLASPSSIQLVPYEADYPSGFQDTRRRVPDVSRAEKVLGFRSVVPLSEGLARTLDWCREHFARGGRD